MRAGMNYSRISLKRNYRLIGVPVELDISGVVYPQPGQPELRAIEMSEGVDLGGPIAVETARPMASIMAQSLIALGLSIEDLNMNADECILTMNGKSRNVTSAKPMPSPAGENDGEIMLFLELV
jgi:hypothetical protein